MKGLQDLCKDITKKLESLEFLEHVRGNAGRLLCSKEHYSAEFKFKVNNIRKLTKLQDYLKSRQNNYQASLEINKAPQRFDEELWHILILAYGGKPSEQEQELIKALGVILKDLEGYSI